MSRQMAQDGLWLEPFSEDNADLVLSWRNAPHVRENSLKDAEITRKDHLAFVAELAIREDRHFFILHENGTPQAVLNVNRLPDGTALWGCYIGGDGPVRPGLFPILIAVASILAFKMLGCDVLHSEVVQGNTTPQKTNSFLGIAQSGRRVETRSDSQQVEVLLYQITATDWPAIRVRMDRILTKRQRDLITEFAADPAGAII